MPETAGATFSAPQMSRGDEPTHKMAPPAVKGFAGMISSRPIFRAVTTVHRCRHKRHAAPEQETPTLGQRYLANALSAL
jgi:hypothetical protein